MKELFIILLALSILLLGCVGEKQVGEKVAESSTLAEDSSVDYALEEADMPFIGENDTVEIGEML